jgi:L-seryl-tRNA(Ser) seleniumtransferase
MMVMPKRIEPQVTEYRKLPAVDALLHQSEVVTLVAEFGQAQVTETIRNLLETARNAIAQGHAAPPSQEWPARIASRLAESNQATLRAVINATGIILHTNLGRAPLSRLAIQAMSETAAGYSNLEYDLTTGERGSRYDHTRRLLSELTGAEDALIVNNCASAVYLMLTALCMQREVLISRGHLVEIGGGFRIPDVLRQSGAHLVEVGTTNRTHAHDFRNAITANTAAILRVHSSNFRQIGFVAMPSIEELAAIAHASTAATASALPGRSLLLLDDLGSGALLDTAQYGLTAEPTVQSSLAAGVDLVAFSGDKLLGGPQAGLIVGRSVLIETLRRHPMARALRVDKLTLAALDATLRSYRRGRASDEIPIWQMIAASAETLRSRAERWRQTLMQVGIAAELRQGESAIGGGSLPGESLPTWHLAIAAVRPDALAACLRAGDPPIVCRIQKNYLLFDPRTVLQEQEDNLLNLLQKRLRLE